MIVLIGCLMIAFDLSDVGVARGLYKMILDNAAAHSGMRHGCRASVSEVRVDGVSLGFQYTLRRVQPDGLWVFTKAYTILAISYFDAERKPLGEAKDVPIWVDGDFVGRRKNSMGASVSVPVPAGARFFSVEMRGYSLATGQIAMPLTSGGQ